MAGACAPGQELPVDELVQWPPPDVLAWLDSMTQRCLDELGSDELAAELPDADALRRSLAGGSGPPAITTRLSGSSPPERGRRHRRDSLRPQAPSADSNPTQPDCYTRFKELLHRTFSRQAKSLRLEAFCLMPEEGLEPPTRGL